MWLFLIYLLAILLSLTGQHFLLASEVRTQSLVWKLKLLEIGLVSLVFTIFLLLSARPLLAAILTLVSAGIFLVVNQAKYKALQEALVFSDIYLYLQVFTHPRLFLPFLNIPLTIIAILLGLGLLYASIYFEYPREFDLTSKLLMLALSSTALVSMRIYANTIKLNFEANRDVRNLGFFNSLFIYAVQARANQNQKSLYQKIAKLSPYNQVIELQQKTEKALDIIVIQSESFFDARNLTSSIRQDVLANFDQACAESSAYGKLKVPAWGANTLRSEYAFLSGIANEDLNYFRFNPYHFIQAQTTLSLVHHLKNQDYYCICIHPNHSAFFKRDRVFPQLGFDEFIDIQSFDLKATSGPYISDQAVANKIIEIVQARNLGKPLFIFAITMENHGPLHLESIETIRLDDIYHSTPPQKHHDLTVYLNHLKNADQMLADLIYALKTDSKERVLCWYGDHVPSMPDVYKELAYQDPSSHYLIWTNKPKLHKQADLAIENLGLKLLEVAGLSITHKS